MDMTMETQAVGGNSSGNSSGKRKIGQGGPVAKSKQCSPIIAGFFLYPQDFLKCPNGNFVSDPDFPIWHREGNENARKYTLSVDESNANRLIFKKSIIRTVWNDKCYVDLEEIDVRQLGPEKVIAVNADYFHEVSRELLTAAAAAAQQPQRN